MKKSIRLWSIFVILMGFITTFSSCHTNDNSDEAENVNLAVGDTLPTFTATFTDGSTIQTQDLKGRCSVIVFFSVRCPDCQRELPEIQRLWDAIDHIETPILLISRAEGCEIIEPYWKKTGLTMPFSAQPNRSLYALFAASRIPRIYICDATNTIRYIHTDEAMPTAETLKDEIESIKTQ